MKKEWFMNLTLSVLAVCAVVLTGMRVMDWTRADSVYRDASKKPRIVDSWRQYAQRGTRIGPANAAVQIIEFSDFQCPACAAFASSLRDIRKRIPNDLAVVYRHYPIVNSHPSALAAALASECANDQHRFEDFHNFLYDNQRVIGVLNWVEIAERSGLSDLPAFRDCLLEERHMPLIVRDTLAARELGISGTPTFLINDHLYRGAPETQELERLIRQALDRVNEE